MATKTIAQHRRQRARKLERKDEDLRWAMQQRMRTCLLCGKEYIANSRDQPQCVRVRQWHGIEVCRSCEALRIPHLHTLVKMGVVKFCKGHKVKVNRYKASDPHLFFSVYGQEGETWQTCDCCRLMYKKVDLRWKGIMICYGCLKAVRLIPRCIELGILKYNKEWV